MTPDASWEEHFARWHTTREEPGDACFRAIEAARRKVGTPTPKDWTWLAGALTDPERKWFVAALFALQPVPKRLFSAFIRAVHEQDASLDRLFVQPCVRSYGVERVATAVRRYLEHGTAEERRGAMKALYWCVE